MMSTPEILPQLDRTQLSLSLREDLWCRARAWAVALWSWYLPPPFLDVFQVDSCSVAGPPQREHGRVQ